MPLRKVRKEVYQLIASSHIQAAFTYLNEILNPESQSIRDLLVVQSAFSLNCRAYIINTIEIAEYQRGCNKATKAILDICNMLTTEDLLFPKKINLDDEHAFEFSMDTPSQPVVLDVSILSEPIEQSGSHLVNNCRRAHIHIAFARKLRRTGKHSEGIVELRKAIELKPYSFKTQTDLAALLRLNLQYDEAIRILTSILDKYPRDAPSRNELANCYRELHNLDLAIEILKEGLKLVDKSNHFHTNLFYVHLFFTCQKEEAILVRDHYTALTGDKLIRDELFRKLYDDFIHQFEAIHDGQAEAEITNNYLTECIHHKKAYATAAKILNKLLKAHPRSFSYQRLRQNIPPQYNTYFD